MRYAERSMIRSFADRETERIWLGGRSRRLPPDIQAAALRKLRLINRARRLDDLRSPGDAVRESARATFDTDQCSVAHLFPLGQRRG
jgi:plasmid maintenance system killer protein